MMIHDDSIAFVEEMTFVQFGDTLWVTLRDVVLSQTCKS
jgi:hypothetical protein